MSALAGDPKNCGPVRPSSPVKQFAAAIQRRAFEVVPYIPSGHWKPVTAYHKNLKGVIQAPAYLMWNIEKT
jgi:peptide/nickel transport system substrate-binding protein